MKERIVLAPGANGRELLKSLAMHGVRSVNLRIVSGGELARIALMRSGIPIAEQMMSFREETAIVAEAVKGETYFGKATYSDIRKIAAAIRRMRMLVADGDEAEQIKKKLEKGIFKDKNHALLSVYKKYMEILADRKLTDTVSLMRKAATGCATVEAEFQWLTEFPLSPLERTLLKRLSIEKPKEKTLADLYKKEDVSLKINSFKNCFGAPNEVETILTDIYASKSLDTCTVAVTDPGTYGQLFFDQALLHDIPITFGCGVPIVNSNPARLLVLYRRWMTDGFFGAVAVRDLLRNEAFDWSKLDALISGTGDGFDRKTFWGILGDLRLTNDGATNRKRIANFERALVEKEKLTDPKDKEEYDELNHRKLCVPALKTLAKELALPAEEFIAKYAYIRRGSATNAQKLLEWLDTAALSAIRETLGTIRASGVVQAPEDTISEVIRMRVASSGGEPGKLYVTGIDGAISALRKNLYIAGLSVSQYPGSPREDYLLLDDDLRLFGGEAEYLTSGGQIRQKNARLIALAKLASGPDAEINVSFAGQDVSELKQDSASSLVFDLCSEERGGNATSKEIKDRIVKVGYFEPAISATRKIGEAYSDRKKILPRSRAEAMGTAGVNPMPDREYSPSALQDFFDCPRKFMLKRVLKVSEPEDEKPFEVIAANTRGKLAHALMETTANSDVSPEAFLKVSSEYFDRFILEHPPLVPQKVAAEREKFLDMMKTAYPMAPHRKVILKEEEIHCEHESGIKLHGFPDRVEELDDGTCLVVDFKAGRDIKHTPDDIDTCLQIVLYAYIMEQKGYKISGGEYRYIQRGETVSCRYDDEMKQKLSDKLKVFKAALKSADFPIPASPACGYCSFEAICGKGQETGGSDDE